MIDRLLIPGEFYWRDLYTLHSRSLHQLLLFPMGISYMIVFFLPLRVFMELDIKHVDFVALFFLGAECFGLYFLIATFYSLAGWSLMRFSSTKQRRWMRKFASSYVTKRTEGLWRIGIFYFVLFFYTLGYRKGRYSREEVLGVLEIMAKYLYLERI